MIPTDDRGLLLGDGLFETILVSDGTLVLFQAHHERLARGCRALGLPEPGDIRGRCEEAALSLGVRGAVRVTLTAGSGGRGLDRPDEVAPRVVVTAAPAPRPQGPASLATVAVRRNEGSPASRLKTLAYLDNVLAREEARAAGADEALMLNNRGEVACAAAANLFWLRDGRLFTPALDCGVLDGIMRRQAMNRAASLGIEVEEVRAARAELDGAEAVFLTNSLIGVRAVGRLDGAALPQSPLVARLAQALADVS